MSDANIRFYFCLGQGTSEAVCAKPQAISDIQFGEGERGDKVVCGKDVSAVITNTGTTGIGPINKIL